MAPRGRSPRVDIKSSSQVPRTAKESEAALTRLQHTSKEGFGHLTKHALGYGAALVGGAGVVGGLEAVVEKGIEAQASQVKVQKAVDNAGLSWAKYKDQIDKAIERQAALGGFAKTDLQDAFANMVRTTGDVNKALHLNNLAMDIARTKGTSLQAAQSLLARVYNGSFLGLKKLGIAIQPVTDAQDKLKASTKHATDDQKRAAKQLDATATSHKALAIVQQKFGGQAKAFGQTTAGALARVKESVDLLEVKLGTALLPAITKVADKAATFINQMRDGTGAGGRFAHQMGEVAHKVGDVVQQVEAVAKWLGHHPELLAAAGAAWATYKVAAVAEIAIVKAASLGLFGSGMKAKLAKEAEGAGASTGRAFASKAGLVAAAGIGGWEIGKELRAHVPAVRSAGDFIGKNLGQAIFGNSDLNDLVDKFAHRFEDIGTKIRSDINHVIGAGNQALQDAAPINPHAGIPRPPSKPNLKAPTKHGHHARSSAAPHAARASRVAAGRKAHIIATAAGEGGGQELGSIQRAAAWVHANYPGVGTLIEDAGGGNQHLHIEGPYNTVVAIGHALQAAGFSVGEHPAFGGVHPVHSHGGLPGIPGDHYTGNAIDVNSDFRSLSPPGSAPGGGTSGSGTSSRTTPVVHTKPKKPKPVKHNARHKVSKSKHTTWERVSARLDNVDLAVSAGQLSEDAGKARKIAIIQNALPHLVGNDARQALAALAELTARDDAAAPSAYDTVEGQIGDIGLHEHAGDYGSDLDAAHKTAVGNEIAAIDNALANPTGLSDEDILQLRAQRGDLVAELNDVSSSNVDLAAAVKDLTDEMKRSNDFANSVSAVSLGTVWKALADVISGQIYGSAYGRAQTAGAGDITRY